MLGKRWEDIAIRLKIAVDFVSGSLGGIMHAGRSISARTMYHANLIAVGMVELYYQVLSTFHPRACC